MIDTITDEILRRAAATLSASRGCSQAPTRAIAAVCAVLDPGVIVVGGSLGLGSRARVRKAAAAARDLVIAQAGRSLVVVPAGLGDRSPLVGAACMAAHLAAPRDGLGGA